MGYVINQLYVENYKLFGSKKLDFGENLLSVFDGPNGYGKTSIFDAIEFLVTGTISRIDASEVIAGTSSYNTVFLAKDSQKDVILKGEFIDRIRNDRVTIGIRIRVASTNGKDNNPKKLLTNAENYKLPAFDTPFESWDNYMLSKEEMSQFRNSKFGEQNIKQFTLFHYIRQEDRLFFLKNTEKDRSELIESLMGVQKEREKQKKVEQARKDLLAKNKDLEKQIREINQKLQGRPNSTLDEVEYISLFNGEYLWDNKDVNFQPGDESRLTGYLRELEALKAYIKYKTEHKKYQAVKIWQQIPREKRHITIRSWLLIGQEKCSVADLEKKKKYLEYLERQQDLINKDSLLDISFAKLCRGLNNEDIGSVLDIEVESLKNLKSSQNETQKRIIEIQSLRERMHTEVGRFEDFDSCPYCGTSWNDRNLLEEHYLDAEKTFKNFLDNESSRFDLQYQKFRKTVINKVLSALDRVIDNEKADPLLQSYCLFDDKEMFSTYINECGRVMRTLKPGFEYGFSEDIEELAERLLHKADNLHSEIADDYYNAYTEFNFELLTKTYFPDFVIPDTINEENIELKKRYLHKLYLQSFDELFGLLQKINSQKAKVDEFLTQMKEYVDALKTAINKYEKQIIDQIEIPFFIYSSRLLQSYQGGQGIFIRNNGKSMRFIAPDSEHDVLYTMSSGQLSAVVLAFSLSMNKIYANEGIRTLFIDDPIQCMDDINVISFVELLRREFSDNQIIVSTHEEQFSDYIRYKFKKYHIETQAITLKDA